MTKLSIQVKCHSCNKNTSLDVDEQSYLSWKKGEKLIQKALPDLTAEQRELLISQTCGFCFDEMWKED
jgi:hypothetical protein